MTVVAGIFTALLQGARKMREEKLVSIDGRAVRLS